MTVRVALVGCGTVAHATHLPGLRAGGDADVVAFASRSLSSAVAAREAWGSGDATTDWRSTVARDDVDAVHVCVPNALHAEVAAQALRAGKHVLVEKPVTTTLADADALLDLAGDRLLGVAFDGRCNPQLQELHRRLPGLGPLRHVEAALGHGGPQLWAPDATWFREPALSGGGCLLDLGVHVLDVLRWCAGPVVEVVQARLDGPVDERAELDLRLESGTTASVRVSWAADEPVSALRFDGENGTLAVEGGELRQDGERVDVPPVELTTAAGAFARAVATGTAPPATGLDGRAALAAALAGYECACTGRPATVR
jgi:UDP-N-acetylglucosamine 3-dehydrogenase